jgi:2-methylcitrate dehydratase PrpD
MTEFNHVTASAVEFMETASYDNLSAEALRIGRRCIIDTLGLYLAGGLEGSVRMLAAVSGGTEGWVSRP